MICVTVIISHINPIAVAETYSSCAEAVLSSHEFIGSV